METKLEQIAVKAVNQLPKSVVREIRTPRSVGAGGGATASGDPVGEEKSSSLPRPSGYVRFRAAFRDIADSSAIARRHRLVDIGRGGLLRASRKVLISGTNTFARSATIGSSPTLARTPRD